MPGAAGELCTISLAISRVRDETGKQHVEVTGGCRELTDMHAVCSTEAQRLHLIQAVVAFCRDVRQHM
jgi:hypothetical protein